MEVYKTELSRTETPKLADALLALLTVGAEWEEPEEAARCCWEQQRADMALQSIVDCNPDQANFYVEAAMCGNAEWLEQMP